jgi:hypothetical protein
MNGLSIEELITKAREENVRIEVEITPDQYGHVTQRITIEPWQPFEYVCPRMIGLKRGGSDEVN